MLKCIWKYLIDLAESVSRARAATELSRQGQHEAARRLMTKE